MPTSVYDNWELTDWERKKCAVWLNDESRKVRAWRKEAEEASTTGERLIWLSNAVTEYEHAVHRRGERFFGYGTAFDARAVGKAAIDAIACHPNTPPTILQSLMENCAKAFCYNPVAPFVLLETPDFIAHLSINARLRLLREENVPYPHVMQIQKIRDDGWLWPAYESCYHVAAYGEVSSLTEWESWIRIFWSQIHDVTVHRLRHQRNSHPVLCLYHDLAELGFAPDWVRDPPFEVDYYERKLSPEVAEWLRFDKPSGSPEEQELWKRIAPRFKRRPEIAAWVGRDATENALARLASLPNEVGCLREVIAAHPNTTPRVMRRFRLPSICNAQQYRTMVFDLNAQYCLATRPDTPTDVLARLAQSHIAQIRLLARRHKNAPANARQLSQRTVRHELSNGYNYRDWPWGFFVHFNAAIRGILSNEQLAIDCLWARSACFRLSAAVALSVEPIHVAIPYSGVRTTTRDLLEHLARDGNRLVRWAAQTRLQNPDYVFRWAETE